MGGRGRSTGGQNRPEKDNGGQGRSVELTGVQERSRDVRVVSGVQGRKGRPGKVKRGQWSPEEVIGRHSGFVK